MGEDIYSLKVSVRRAAFVPPLLRSLPFLTVKQKVLGDEDTSPRQKNDSTMLGPIKVGAATRRRYANLDRACAWRWGIRCGEGGGVA